MARPVRLDNVAHANLRVLPAFGAAYGHAVNQVLIFPAEFRDMARHYPILFRRDSEGRLSAVAIMGLERDQNLFLEDGRWLVEDVPAMQRRGPFLIGYRPSAGNGGSDEPDIRIDLDDPRVRDEGDEGHPLFLSHGGTSPFLAEVGAVLRLLHDGTDDAAAMFAAFETARLIEPLQLQVNVTDTDQINFDGYLTIAADRLAALADSALQTLYATGYLPNAIHAAASLDNFARLATRWRRRS